MSSEQKMGRREFIGATAIAGTALSALSGVAAASAGEVSGGSVSGGGASNETGAPAMHLRKASRPVVISSANGFIHKNGGSETCVELAFRAMTQGRDVLESLVAGVNIVELDPDDTSVGYGGLPDADGNVSLDSCCMHGPKRRAGGVAALQGVRTPASVALAVANSTDHHLLVGPGAQQFARNMGFKIEADLNTERSRKLWLEWKQRVDPEHYLDPNKRADASLKVILEMVGEGKIDPFHFWGTINCNGVNANGDVCGVTTTSGLAWKIPGRVGDSPILGAGLYVDNEVGAAGSTGRGEANLYNLSSFLIVEMLRQGKHPKDAGMEALRRICSNTVEKRLLTEQGHPKFNVSFYVVNKAGDYAGVSMYGGANSKFAVCDEKGPRHELFEPFLDAPLPEGW
ncbi:MAG: N(4)-(beta-N-acetylglucosaminyl)-L-asparaginase [Planctomycetota bacterium]|jgi:N4-(beta-N-acetylglucosaminyl)-L-asparaginase|nr:N(4)-(beta-N-acetylglucosaminyl)-L-asparaginase [Blastopirellula sp.]